MHSNQEVILRGRVRGRCIGTLNTNSWAAKHLIKNGRASTALEILTLFKIKSVARIQAPFFRVEAKLSLEPPTD